MTDSALAIAVPLIAEFEGFSDAPYQDAGGVWTIGFGFTEGVTADAPAMTYSDAMAKLWALVEVYLKNVRIMVHVPMTANQAAALTSFAFNMGTHALRTSTLLRLFEAGEVVEASRQFASWVYDDGHLSRGLVKRRAAEAALFLKPESESADDLNAAELKSISVGSV